MSDTYDVIIIGSGPGGYVAAIRAGQLGLKTAIVEREWLGGTCLNVGCIPTKVLLRTAEVLTLAREGKEFGVVTENPRLDMTAALARKDKIVLERRRGVELLMKKNQATVFMGTGSLTAPNRVTVRGKDGNQEIEGRNIIIATGSAPKTIPGVTIDEKTVVSSTGALLFSEVPGRLVVIGAGAVGVEFASLYQEFGSQVTLIEALPQILPLEDKDSASEVARAFRSRGIRMMVSARVGGVTVAEKGVKVQVTGSDGAAEDIEADKLLMAIGRRPLTENLGLEALGVKTERGFIVVDGVMRSSVPNIWAIGDCIAVQDMGAHMLLAHVASAEGILAVETMAGKDTHPLDYNAIPRAVYSHPEVASLGLTEEQAVQQGYKVKVGKFPLRANSRTGIIGERVGMAKVVADEKYGEILGVHMVGPNAPEIIHEIAVAKRLESTVEEVARTVHAHPTVSEAVKEAAEAVFGAAIDI